MALNPSIAVYSLRIAPSFRRVSSFACLAFHIVRLNFEEFSTVQGESILSLLSIVQSVGFLSHGCESLVRPTKLSIHGGRLTRMVSNLHFPRFYHLFVYSASVYIIEATVNC